MKTFFRGLGRPQGLAFDRDGNLFVAACYAGQRGIVRITAAQHCTPCHTAGVTMGAATMKLDLKPVPNLPSVQAALKLERSSTTTFG